MGFDLDPFKIEKIAQCESYIKHINSDELAKFVSQSIFSAITDFSRLGEPDVLLICVPTPLTRNREPDLQYVKATVKAIASSLRPGQLVVLESTTHPGTTVEVVQPILEESKLTVEVDFVLAFSPERGDPGNSQFVTASIPKVVGGVGPLSTRLAEKFYALVIGEGGYGFLYPSSGNDQAFGEYIPKRQHRSGQ